MFADNSSVVTPSVSEFKSYKGFNKIEKDHPSMVTVDFDCHAHGETTIGVAIQLTDGAFHFQFLKRCPETEDDGVDIEVQEASPTHKHMRKKRQGHYIKGFMVGTSEGGSEVVRDGWLQPEYFLPDVGESLEDVASVIRRRAKIVPYSRHNITFYLVSDM